MAKLPKYAQEYIKFLENECASRSLVSPKDDIDGVLVRIGRDQFIRIDSREFVEEWKGVRMQCLGKRVDISSYDPIKTIKASVGKAFILSVKAEE